MKILLICLMVFSTSVFAVNNGVSIHKKHNPVPQEMFKIKIKATTNNTAFLVNLESPINLIIQWGDKKSDTYTYAGNRLQVHTYKKGGTYTIGMYGSVTNIDFFTNTNTTNLITEINPIKGISGLSRCTSTFRNCKNITTIPVDMFRYVPDVTDFTFTFFDCIGLTSIPSNLFEYQTYAHTFQFAFSNCVGLTSIPNDLFIHNSYLSNIDSIFRGCNKITSIPSDFLNTSNNPHFTSAINSFRDCVALNGEAPELWNLINGIVIPIGDYCFNGDVGLTNYNSIPAGWK